MRAIRIDFFAETPVPGPDTCCLVSIAAKFCCNYTMTPNDLLNKFTRQFSEVVGPGIQSLNDDMRQQVRAAAQAAFEKMDLISREEFEAQKSVLLRTREKLEALEKQVAALEAGLEPMAQTAGFKAKSAQDNESSSDET